MKYLHLFILLQKRSNEMTTAGLQVRAHAPLQDAQRPQPTRLSAPPTSPPTHSHTHSLTGGVGESGKGWCFLPSVVVVLEATLSRTGSPRGP